MVAYGDIVNELPLEQPPVSQHLNELKNAGLIKGNIRNEDIGNRKLQAILNMCMTRI